MDYVKYVHNVQFHNFVPSLIYKLAISDSSILAVARSDDTIELWNCFDQPFRLKILNCAENLECLVWCKKRLFTGHLNGEIFEHLFEQPIPQTDKTICETVKNRVTKVSGGACWALAVNTSRNIIAAATNAGFICLYDVLDDGLYFIKILDKLPGTILSLSWLPSDDNVVAAVGNCLHICSLASNPVRTIQVARKVSKRSVTVLCVTTLSDGTIVSGDSRGAVSFWRSDDGTMINSVVSHKAAVLCLAVSADSCSVYAAGIDPVLRILRRSNTVWCSAVRLELHSRDVRSIAVDSTGRVYSGGLDAMLGVHEKKRTYTLLSVPAVITASDSVVLSNQGGFEWWRLGQHKLNDTNFGTKLALERDRLLLAKLETSTNVKCVALSPAANSVAYSLQHQNRIIIRKLHTPKILNVTGENVVLSHKTSLYPAMATADHIISLDTETLYCTSSQCGSVLFTASATACAVHYLLTGKSRILPRHPSPITAICARPGQPVTVTVAYADLAILEYDVQTGLITPFGQKVSTVLQTMAEWRSVCGMSWHKGGDLLCLHDQESFLFLSRKSILSYDWNSLPTDKKQKCEETKRVDRTCTLNTRNNKIISYTSKKHRVRVANSSNYALKQAWQSLTHRIFRHPSKLALVSQQNDHVLCVEVPLETLEDQLPAPLKVNKFATK